MFVIYDTMLMLYMLTNKTHHVPSHKDDRMKIASFSYSLIPQGWGRVLLERGEEEWAERWLRQLERHACHFSPGPFQPPHHRGNAYRRCVVRKRNRDTKVSAVTEWMRLIIRVQFIHGVLLTNRFFTERFTKNRGRDYPWMKGAVKSRGSELFIRAIMWANACLCVLLHFLRITSR